MMKKTPSRATLFSQRNGDRLSPDLEMKLSIICSVPQRSGDAELKIDKAKAEERKPVEEKKTTSGNKKGRE